MFGAVADALPSIESVLYAGSYVDIAPSFVWSDVTYLDMDKRAARFFTDESGVQELLIENGVEPGAHNFTFLHTDYQSEVAFMEDSVDLLVSLYAGLISASCTRFLRIGGHLLVNSSHGDAAMASIDARYELRAVVKSSNGEYSVSHSSLGSYLIPKRDVVVNEELIRQTGRGVAYTTSPYAYLFERTS